MAFIVPSSVLFLSAYDFLIHYFYRYERQVKENCLTGLAFCNQADLFDLPTMAKKVKTGGGGGDRNSASSTENLIPDYFRRSPDL
jgi:hypothetical protein